MDVEIGQVQILEGNADDKNIPENENLNFLKDGEKFGIRGSFHLSNSKKTNKSAIEIGSHFEKAEEFLTPTTPQPNLNELKFNTLFHGVDNKKTPNLLKRNKSNTNQKKRNKIGHERQSKKGHNLDSNRSQEYIEANTENSDKGGKEELKEEERKSDGTERRNIRKEIRKRRSERNVRSVKTGSNITVSNTPNQPISDLNNINTIDNANPILNLPNHTQNSTQNDRVNLNQLPSPSNSPHPNTYLDNYKNKA
jgi:hypothetical protein